MEETARTITTTTEPRHTCIKLQTSTDPTEPEPIFVKGTWFHSHFHLSVTDGLHSWVCNATEDEVRERAEQWDQEVTDYIHLAEKHLGFQQPDSLYRFADAGDGNKRLSWTFEKEGTKLEWRWKCQLSSDNKKTTAGILDFLMDANIRLSEEVVRKSKSFEPLKEEAEKCLAQSERFCSEKLEFESAIYAKFAAVLNSKKRKLRKLRDQLSKKVDIEELPQDEEEESTDKTQSFDEGGSDDAGSEEVPPGTSKDAATSSRGRGRGRKRNTGI